MIDSSSPKLLLTVEQAAEELSIGRSLMYELVLRRELPSVKIGRCRRISRRDLETFVETLGEEPSEPKFRKI